MEKCADCDREAVHFITKWIGRCCSLANHNLPVKDLLDLLAVMLESAVERLNLHTNNNKNEGDEHSIEENYLLENADAVDCETAKDQHEAYDGHTPSTPTFSFEEVTYPPPPKPPNCFWCLPLELCGVLC